MEWIVFIQQPFAIIFIKPNFESFTMAAGSECLEQKHATPQYAVQCFRGMCFVCIVDLFFCILFPNFLMTFTHIVRVYCFFLQSFKFPFTSPLTLMDNCSFFHAKFFSKLPFMFHLIFENVSEIW